MGHFPSALAVLLLLLTSVAAQDFDTGAQAYRQGDYATALRQWHPLAEQGAAVAQFNLGIMYERGQGVRQDPVDAAKWYRLAADQGIVYAQGNLGEMYANGSGVPQDNVQAHMWWSIAAAQGFEGPARNRDIVASKMTPDQIAEAQRMARAWLAVHPPK